MDLKAILQFGILQSLVNKEHVYRNIFYGSVLSKISLNFLQFKGVLIKCVES